METLIGIPPLVYPPEGSLLFGEVELMETGLPTARVML